MVLKKLFLMVLLTFIFPFASGKCFSAEKGFDAGPLQLSFFDPIQLIPDDFDVYGLRLTFPYGVNNSVFGLDLGVWNTLSGDLGGIGFSSLVSNCRGSMYGVNTGGIANINGGDQEGWSIAGFYNSAGGTVKGLQSTIVYNEAKNVAGVQLAIVNYCEDLSGIQLGIVNICKAQWIPFTILLNVWF